MITVLGASLAALAVYGFEVIRKGAYRIAKAEAGRVAVREATSTAEIVAARVATAYLEQAGPDKVGTGDYGNVAGEDQNGDKSAPH